MTGEGVKQLYMWLSTAWPLVIRPGVDESWKQAKLRELYTTYEKYRDAEVIEAFQKWTEEHDKYPTTKNIINEIEWAQRLRASGGRENTELWDMSFIKDNGEEWSYGAFRRDAFVTHPRNPDHLQPEEWERRYKIRRRQVLNRLYKEARG